MGRSHVVFQLPTLLAPFSPLEAFGLWGQLCRSWRQRLWAENTRKEVLSHLNFGVLRLDHDKSISACEALAKYIPDTLHVLNLDFFRCHLGQAAVEQLASAIPPGLLHLQLGLTRSRVGSGGLQRLAEKLPSSLRNLWLDVGSCSVGNEGILAINLQALPDLKSFHLSAENDLKVDDTSLHFLADGISSLSTLRLDFSRCRVSFRGIQYLAQRLPALDTLQLSFCNCYVSPDGASSLAARLPPTLTELSLNFCRGEIGDDGALSISKQLPASLRKLYLNWKDSGVRSMAPITTLLSAMPSSVQVLRLDLTGIPVQMEALVFPPHLTHLDLTVGALKGDVQRWRQSFPGRLKVDSAASEAPVFSADSFGFAGSLPLKELL